VNGSLSAIVVEDNARDRERLQSVVELVGFQVEAYYSGEKALEAVKGGAWCDLVLADAVLATDLELTGAGLVRAIRREKVGVCTVGVSGVTPSMPEVGDLQNTCDYFLPKPNYDGLTEVEAFETELVDVLKECKDKLTRLYDRMAYQRPPGLEGGQTPIAFMGTCHDPNVIAFRAHFEEWLETMPGEYVALVDGKLVAHDANRSVLKEKVLEQDMGKPIFITRIQVKQDKPATFLGGTWGLITDESQS
jgi:CheY-like chemotaxis protein